MRVLVTGASGFIGKHLVAHLVRSGHEVTCFVRTRGGQLRDLPVALVEGDLRRTESLSGLPSQVDAVVHLAQANVSFPDEAREMFTVNVSSTVLLADYARRARAQTFVFASSGNVYGPSAAPLKETDRLSPQSFYGMCKEFSERILGHYGADFNVQILRFFAPYGPGQVNRLIPTIIDRVRRGIAVTLTNGGQPWINPIYVTDAVHVLEAVLTLPSHHTVNVAGPQVITIKELADLVGEADDCTPAFEHRSSGATSNLIGDTARLRSLFPGYEYVPPRQGIRDTVEWTRRTELPEAP
jgi:UDP-glucose 4-epimerase